MEAREGTEDICSALSGNLMEKGFSALSVASHISACIALPKAVSPGWAPSCETSYVFCSLHLLFVGVGAATPALPLGFGVSLWLFASFSVFFRLLLPYFGMFSRSPAQ